MRRRLPASLSCDMNRLLLTCCLCLLALTNPAKAANFLGVPLDTIVGHTHMLRVISEAMCSKLEVESRRIDFKQLNPHQSDKLIEGLTFQTLGEHLKDFQTLLETIPKRKRNAYTQKLGREALLKMADDCQAAHNFLPDLNYQATEDKSPITEAEKAVLQVIASNSCQRFADEEARLPLESRTSEERKTAIVQAIQSSILISAPELMQYYGENIMTDQQRLGNVSERMGLLMLGSCPKYLLMLSLHPAKQ